MDEIEVWRDIENENLMNDHNEKLKAVAVNILEVFQPIIKIFENLEKEPIGNVVGHIDRIFDCLNALWTHPEIYFIDIQSYYPQKRMENMFKVISRSIGVRIEKVFKENDMWQ
jgi:hypothetical protein